MIVGFSGTSEGLTTVQFKRLGEELKRLPIGVAHHGDCSGADANFHSFVRKLHPEATIVVHPPDNTKKRAFCDGDKIMPEKPYPERNAVIAFAAEYMIACPKERSEQMRSGTWATVRKARQYGKPILFIFPDGTTLKAES